MRAVPHVLKILAMTTCAPPYDNGQGTQVIFASALGTVFEGYDFDHDGSLAAIIMGILLCLEFTGKGFDVWQWRIP